MCAARLYNELAEWWPVISDADDYREEAAIVRAVLTKRLGAGRHTLLELGAGGGCLLSHLTAEFDAVGVDLSPDMLAASRRLNPGVEYVLGDMRSVRLGRTFDAVLIHDAIGHMTTREDLEAAFETAAAHLRPGGVFVVCPEWFRENFPDDSLSHSKHQMPGAKLTCIEYVTDLNPTDTSVELLMIFLEDRDGARRMESDQIDLGLFEKSEWIASLQDAGFHVETVPNVEGAEGIDRVMYVCELRD